MGWGGGLGGADVRWIVVSAWEGGGKGREGKGREGKGQVIIDRSRHHHFCEGCANGSALRGLGRGLHCYYCARATWMLAQGFVLLHVIISSAPDALTLVVELLGPDELAEACVIEEG